MTTLYVGSAPNRISIAAALAQAVPGDVVSLAPGVYQVGSVTLSGLTLVGEGSAEATTLVGTVVPQGSCSLASLTVSAQPRGSAIAMMRDSSAYLSVTDCRIAGDPTASTITVGIDGGTLVLNRVAIADDADLTTVRVRAGARLHATASSLGGLEVRGGSADLIGCAAHLVLAADGARVHGYAPLDLTPVPGKRALRVLSGATLELECVRLSGDQVFEAQANAATLRIAQIESPSSAVFRVLAEAEAAVYCDSGYVEVVRSSPMVRKAPQARAGSSPQRVLWPAHQGGSFASDILPRIKPGDTLVLEEGRYSFENTAGNLYPCEFNLDGEGRRDRIVLQGGLEIPSGANVTMTNFTIEHPVTDNAVYVSPGADLSMHGMTVRSHPAAEFPALFVEGALTATACELRASPAETRATITVMGEGRVSALACELGWCDFGASCVVSLENCTVIRVAARDQAKVVSAGTLGVTPNLRNQCSLTGRGQASLDLDVLDFPAGCEINVGEQSLLSFTSFASGRTPKVTLEGSGQVVRGLTGNREGARGAMVTASLPTRAGAPADPGSDGEDISGLRDDSLAALNHLIGLRKVKEQAAQFVKNAVINRERAELGLKSMPLTLHSLFLGNPGTGKTTVARLLGKALYAEGVVSSDVFVEVGRPDLVGQYLGDSALMTEKVLDSARGGILFIDEAYSLAQALEEDYGQEVLDTIIAYMENH